jgi:hypothetical protein
MTPTSSADAWLRKIQQNLAEAKYVLYPRGGEMDHDHALVARRSCFQLSKFGFSETFFVFEEFDTVTSKQMGEFSAAAFAHALRTRKCFLPRGLFEFVACFAVAITDRPQAAAVQMVREQTPPRHWTSVEFPVIYDRARDQLHYLEKTPLWGGAYYRGFRKTVQRLLGDVSSG